MNPKVTMGVLHKMLPLRVSVEIECINSLSRFYGEQNNILHRNREKQRRFHVIEYSDDERRKTEMSEHRISIQGYKQALGLYKILHEMKKACLNNPESGIHIHVDTIHFTDKLNHRSRENRDKLDELLKVYLTTRLDDTYNLFDSCYTGTYNNKEVRISEKGSWVNIRSDWNSYGTIEFRIGYCTFEYEKIMEWMIGCTRIVKDAFNQPEILKLLKR